MLQRYLLLWLVVSSGVAYAWPAIVSRLPRGLGWLGDPFHDSKPILPWLIALIMFCIGQMLPRDEVRQVVGRWPAVLSGTAIQYSVMPLLAFVMAQACGLTGAALIGVILVGCVPGAMASNVLTLNAHGNTSYSVSLTTAATLLSPLVVPLAMGLALRGAQASDKSVLWDACVMLVLTVVLPVLAGHLVSRSFPVWEARSRYYGTIIANLVILWVIAAVVGRSREQLGHVDGRLFAALLGVNVLGYAAGYGGGWLLGLPEPMRRALTLEVGMQNAGLGATMALQLFPDQEGVAIAPALYTFGCMLTGTILANAWAWAGRERANHEEPSQA